MFFGWLTTDLYAKKSSEELKSENLKLEKTRKKQKSN